jgi:hypothetical protein
MSSCKEHEASKWNGDTKQTIWIKPILQQCLSEIVLILLLFLKLILCPEKKRGFPRILKEKDITSHLDTGT